MTSSGATPRAVVAGHGGFAAGLVSAVEKVTGMGGAFVPVSNEGLETAGLERTLRDALDRHAIFVVFTDLPAGSCTLAARRLAHADPRVAVVTGATLPMLLDFALSKGGGTAALERAAEKGRAAIAVTPAREAPRAD